jgi:hypothetical protein
LRFVFRMGRSVLSAIMVDFYTNGGLNSIKTSCRLLRQL